MKENFLTQYRKITPTYVIYHRLYMRCPDCAGTGYDFGDGGQCDRCDGTGEI